MKKILIFIIAVVSLLLLFTYKPNSKYIDNIPQTQEKSEEVHIHAGFQVYQDDVLQDYSDIKYMHIEPCSEEENHEHEDEQIEKAHLHSNIGDVVHVHKQNSFWKDLFNNIKAPINPSSSGYINGSLVRDFLNTPIQDHDILVVFEGENNDKEEKLSNSISKDRIIEAELSIESCGK